MLDTVTEFGAALETLKPDAPEPVLRQTVGLVYQTPPATEVPASAVDVAMPEPALIAEAAATSAETSIGRRWTDRVLVPDYVRLSRAFTSKVPRLQVEAHRLAEGQPRLFACARRANAF